MATTEHPNIGVGFITFLKSAQERVNQDYASAGYQGTPPTLEIESGPRYIRVISNHGSSRSAFAFIDKTTGDVLYPAGWKSPAKNFARGNVFDDKHGCGRIRWTGVH